MDRKVLAEILVVVIISVVAIIAGGYLNLGGDMKTYEETPPGGAAPVKSAIALVRTNESVNKGSEALRLVKENGERVRSQTITSLEPYSGNRANELECVKRNIIFEKGRVREQKNWEENKMRYWVEGGGFVVTIPVGSSEWKIKNGSLKTLVNVSVCKGAEEALSAPQGNATGACDSIQREERWVEPGRVQYIVTENEDVFYAGANCYSLRKMY